METTIKVLIIINIILFIPATYICIHVIRDMIRRHKKKRAFLVELGGPSTINQSEEFDDTYQKF